MTVSLKIEAVSLRTQIQAKAVIYRGFSEYFSTIRPELNPDLEMIIDYYKRSGYLFLVGILDNTVVCTGGFKPETKNIARIVRMSVDKPYRKLGFASQMLLNLEERAQKLGYKAIVIETNKDWNNPIELYLKNGYKVSKVDRELIHFLKEM